MAIKYIQSVLAAPTPAQKVRKQAKTKIDGLNKKIDQARDAKSGSATVDKRKKQNQKIRDAHHQLDQVRNDHSIVIGCPGLAPLSLVLSRASALHHPIES